MADSKISNLPALPTVDSADLFAVVDVSTTVTKKSTLAQVKTSLALAKGDVGLGNVDNTSDANKPVKPSVIRSMSSGLISGGVVTINADPTKFDISAGTGQVLDNWTTPLTPAIIDVSWSAFTAVVPTFLATNPESWVGISSTGAVVQYAATFTPEQSRDIIPLAKLAHNGLTTINNIVGQASVAASPADQFRDLLNFCKLINGGVAVSANGANLNINRSAGNLFSIGANYITSLKNPNIVAIASAAPLTFQYRTQTGVASANTTSIVPGSYDLAGTVTAIAGSNNQATNQRVYQISTGNVRIQYGQTIHATLSAAVAAIPTETFTPFSNLTNSAILIGVISVTKGCTALNSAATAIFTPASRFGELSNGTGGTSTTTIQQAYDNSSTPEVLTDSTRGAVTVRRGSAADTDTVYEGQNGAGSTTFSVTGAGDIVAGTYNGYTPANRNRLDPELGIYWIEHFMATTAVGTMGWTATANSGTNGVNSSAGSGTIMGIYRGDTSTSASSAPTLSLGNGASVVLGGAETTFAFRINIPTLSTLTEEYIIRVGLHNSTTSAAPTNAVIFEYDRLNSVNWRLRAINGGASTVTTSASAVTTSWSILKCVINSAGTLATFSIDGVSVGTVATNIPTGVGATVSPTLQIIKSAGTTARVYYIDWYNFQVVYP